MPEKIRVGRSENLFLIIFHLESLIDVIHHMAWSRHIGRIMKLSFIVEVIKGLLVLNL